VALANAQMYWSARALIEQFEEALASRDAIGQAKGIIMARSGGDADDAFDVVRRASQRENKKLPRGGQQRRRRHNAECSRWHAGRSALDQAPGRREHR
jgi:hypothetical protein